MMCLTQGLIGYTPYLHETEYWKFAHDGNESEFHKLLDDRIRSGNEDGLEKMLIVWFSRMYFYYRSGDQYMMNSMLKAIDGSLDLEFYMTEETIK